MQRQIPLSNIQNASAGKKAQIICPVGDTYDQIVLAYTGTAVARADLTNIKVLASGEEIQFFTDGDELDWMNDFYGRADTAGYLTLHFNRKEMKGLSDERIYGLGTADQKSLVVEIDIDPTAPADFGLTADALVSAPQPLGVFCRVKKFNFNASVAGDLDITTLTMGPRIMAIHVVKADAESVLVKADEVTIFDTTKVKAEVVQKNYGRTPQTAKATHIDLCLEGDAAGALITELNDKSRPYKTTKDVLVRPYLATAGAGHLLVEYFDTLIKRVA